jgi:hypothetical protein
MSLGLKALSGLTLISYECVKVQQEPQEAPKIFSGASYRNTKSIVRGEDIKYGAHFFLIWNTNKLQ